MKMFFKDGYVQKETIHFEPASTDIEVSFDESVDRITHMMTRYDFNLFKDEIYYIYDIAHNKDEIEKELELLCNGKMDNVCNEKSCIIMSLNKKNDTSIFWDTFNHFIIVIGKENLKRMIYELEKARWENFLKIFNNSIDDFDSSSLSPIMQKSKKL